VLPETKQYVLNLKLAGLTRQQFRIRTPWNVSTQEYGPTIITLVGPLSQLAPHLKELSKFFKVTVTCLDGMPVHVSVDTVAEPGLYKRENGAEEQVAEIEYQGDFEQLPLWPQEPRPEQSRLWELSAQEEDHGLFGLEQEV
jgi:hypothetical protein